MSEEQNDCGWCKVWHPRGVQVTVPLRGDITTFMGQVNSLLDSGFLVQAPGLEAGEEKEEIGWVCRLDHDKDGEITPTVLLYSTNEALTYSFLRRYMNKPEDVAAFEYASGVKYDQLPDYQGNDHPQRGASQKSDRFIVKTKPFGLIWKPNPKYKEAPAGQDTRSLSEKRKRDFVRWADVSTAPVQEKKADPESILGKVQARISTNPDLATINSMTSYWMKQPQENPDKIECINAIHQYAVSKMWEWENELGKYVEKAF